MRDPRSLRRRVEQVEQVTAPPRRGVTDAEVLAEMRRCRDAWTETHGPDDTFAAGMREAVADFEAELGI